MIFRSNKSATVPSSTKQHNKQLDQQIVDQEAVDWSDPWRMRKYFVTLLSTMKNLFVLRSNKQEPRDPNKQ
jgi:hypothetical protein